MRLKCNTCHKEKPRDSFYKYRKHQCIECTLRDRKRRYKDNKEKHKLYQKEYRERVFQDQGGYVVYYLPEHHYVGMTNNLKKRVIDHKKKGKIVEGIEVVGTYETAVEAHYVETSLHLMGYEGFSYKGGWRKVIS